MGTLYLQFSLISSVNDSLNVECYFTLSSSSCVQSLQVAQRDSQIRLLEGQLRQTDVIGSSHNHMILDALREKAEYIPELQALIHNVQQGEGGFLCLSEIEERERRGEHPCIHTFIFLFLFLLSDVLFQFSCYVVQGRHRCEMNRV